MIALGMVLMLNYMFVRKTIGFTDPIERSYLPFFFLGAGFMLVETRPSPSSACIWRHLDQTPSPSPWCC
jgi:hypothetical protein